MKSGKIVLLLILLAVCLPAISQVPVERSKDKVVISGVPYFVHQVKKGETAYSISRAYGISVEELTRQNPVVRQGLNEGQSLRIAVSSVPVVTQQQPQPVRQVVRDETKFIYHVLQPGETIYSLSRRYGFTENDILQSNPGIEISRLSLGTEIAIPRKDIPDSRGIAAVQAPKGNYHKVVNGETLTSIAQKYGLTLRELRRENRDMRFPQVGDYIKIPGMKAAQITEAEPEPAEEVLFIAEEPPVVFERPEGYTPVSSLKGSFDVAVLLPFYLNENAKRTDVDSSKSFKGKKIYKVINRTDDWIYPRSLGFVEMYEGILLAADTLRSLGLDINLHVYDIRSDTVEITRLIRSGKLDRMDLIIGPVHSGNLNIVASYAANLGIPVVSPVPLVNNSSLTDNPTLFMATSSLEVVQRRIARSMSDLYDHNFVLIHADTDENNYNGRRLKDMIISELSYKMPAEEVSVKDLVFYSRSAFGTDSVNRLARSLSDKNGNVVIIASEDAPVMSESIMDVHALVRKYNMKVFGYPYMRSLDNLDPKYFFDLGLMIYSPNWVDYSKDDVIKFNSAFMTRYSTHPSEMSYAWQGYDITYYFLSGLAMHGREFILRPEIHNPDLLHTEFDFRRKSVTDGFENQKLFLIRYTNSYEIELVNGN